MLAAESIVQVEKNRRQQRWAEQWIQRQACGEDFEAQRGKVDYFWQSSEGECSTFIDDQKYQEGE